MKRVLKTLGAALFLGGLLAGCGGPEGDGGGSVTGDFSDVTPDSHPAAARALPSPHSAPLPVAQTPSAPAPAAQDPAAPASPAPNGDDPCATADGDDCDCPRAQGEGPKDENKQACKKDKKQADGGQVAP